MQTDNLSSLFAPLKNYGPGSGRAELLPLDESVNRAALDPALRKALEKELIATLKNPVSDVAKEYICAKLTRVGSEACVPTVSALLADRRLALPARATLEAIGGKSAAKAMRKALGQCSGLELLGVIASVGEMRDEGSCRELGKFLANADPQVAATAANALGKIGSKAAAHLLQEYSTKVSAANERTFADAMLVCAERLEAKGQGQEGASLRGAASKLLDKSAKRLSS